MDRRYSLISRAGRFPSFRRQRAALVKLGVGAPGPANDDLCRAEFDERLGQPGTELAGDDPDVLREQSREALRAYLAELASGVSPVSVERRFELRFELRFEGAEWSLVGYLDVENASGDTIDVKVGAKHVSEARAERDPQPTAYELARRVEGRPEGRFLFHSIRRGQSGPASAASS